MSQLNTKKVKLGDSADISKNFLLSTPTVPDGTFRISRESGTSILTINADGSITASGTITATFAESNIKPLLNATGTAPVYACRAWVVFDGKSAGTWAGGASTVTRIAGSATATVTTTSPHGLITGNSVYALTGVVAGAYTVTVINATTFTFITAETTALSAVAITFDVHAIRASGNVSSVAGNGTGDFTINFSVSMPTASYSVVGGAGTGGVADDSIFHPYQVSAPTASAVRCQTRNAGASLLDYAYVSVSVFC